MKCSNCGKVNESNAKFCEECGKVLNKEKRHRKKSLIFILVGAMIISTLAISYYFVSKNTNEKKFTEMIAQADRFVEEKNYEQAEDYYLKAIEIDSKQVDPYLKLADIYKLNNNTDQAKSILNQGLNKVEKENQSLLEKKLEELNEGIQNNGMEHLVYNNNTYYWQYTSEAIKHDGLFANFKYIKSNQNILLVTDKNGNKKVLYKGNGSGKIAILNNRIYLQRYPEKNDESTIELFSIDLNGNNEKSYGKYQIKSVSNNNKLILSSPFNTSLYIFDPIKDTIIYKEDAVNYLTLENNNIYFSFSKDDGASVTLKSINSDDLKVTTLAKVNKKDIPNISNISSPLTINCVQELDDKVYFSYGVTDGTAHVYQGGQIAVVDKKNSNFKVLNGSPMLFAVLSNKEIKENAIINEPFLDENGDVCIYDNKHNDKIKLLENGKEYTQSTEPTNKINAEHFEISNNYLFYTIVYSTYDSSVSMGWRDGYQWEKSIYYKKNLDDGLVEELYEIQR